MTNAIELVGNPTMSVIMTGGMIRPTTFGASGQLAAATLRGLHVDQTFLAIHSVSVSGGLTYPLFEEVDAKRAMIEAADEVILLADHSKFGRQALVRVAPITAVQRIITTAGIDPGEAAAIRDLGIELIIVEPEDGVADLERSAAAGQFAIPLRPRPQPVRPVPDPVRPDAHQQGIGAMPIVPTQGDPAARLCRSLRRRRDQRLQRPHDGGRPRRRRGAQAPVILQTSVKHVKMTGHRRDVRDVGRLRRPRLRPVGPPPGPLPGA